MTSAKSYYKIGEVAEMLGVPATTLRYWEREFDALSPARVGNQRRYTKQDIDIVKRISELLYDRRLTTEAAKTAMSGYRKCRPRRALKCRDAKTALVLLGEIKTMTFDEHIIGRVEAVEGWVNNMDSQS